MKKIYSLLGLLAFVAMPAFAQDEEDVTSLIANPGFDEDITWQADGSTKEIVDKSVSISDRTQVWRAADNTTYAHAKTAEEGNSKKRKDGFTGPVWNGFFGQINGWTAISDNQEKPEWVYFGSVSYGMETQAIAIADDGDTFLYVPEKPAEDAGEDNKGALYLRAGWGAQAIYKQEVKLPCAQYRLEYWIYNTNYEGSKDNTSVQNLCQVTCRKDTWKDDEGFNCQDWTKHTIEFTPTASFSMQFGFKSSDGSGSNPFILLDAIKLYKIGEADVTELLQSDIMDMIDSINGVSEEYFGENSGIQEEIQDRMNEFEDAAYSGDEDEMKKAYEDIQAYAATVQAAVASVEKLMAVIESAKALQETTGYPGFEAFSEAIDAAETTAAEGTMAQVEEAIATLQQAIKAYIVSQEAPADFTAFIDNPTFAAQGAWYIGQTGGDQRVKSDATDSEGNTISCWNAWRNNLTSAATSVSIQQDLTGLPNGHYTVTADLCTQDGCITDQHVYASSSVATAVSPVMTQTGWDPMVWETVVTEDVIVVDGKLTIGAIGHGDDKVPSDCGGSNTDARRGWFCLTNVKLTFTAAATDEEIAAATAKAFTDAEAVADAMHYAADKAAAKEAIAAAKAATDLDALKEALKEAEASETDYVAVTSGTLKTLTDSVFTSANVNAVNKVIVTITNNYINSAEATYKKTATYTSILQQYLNTLDPAIINAETTEVSAANAKAVLDATIKGVVDKLLAITALPTSDEIDAQVAALNEAVRVAKIGDIEWGADKDVTAYMANPNIDAIDGWTVVKPVGDGNGRKSGQDLDGKNGGYIDTYNSTVGALRATIYQTMNVPNGTYKVENIMRAGGYLFASDAALVEQDDAVVAAEGAALVLAKATPVATNRKYIDGETTDSLTNDQFGQIWMSVADELMAKYNITSATDGSSIFDFVVEANNGSETCPEGFDADKWNIFSANAGKGRGWFNNSIETIEVKNHTLTVGVSCDSVLVGEPLAGTWFSADNFKLTMLTVGDNSGWDPTSAIEAVAAKSEADVKAVAIFTVSGARVAGIQKGINIVKYSDGSVQKIYVK